ncbi:MAG: aldose epimerase family protein [Opitutaceae bacterium]
MSSRVFGSLSTGEPVEAHLLANPSGASVEILTYGGIIRSLKVPDRNGQIKDVVLGFNDFGPYLAGHPFFGAITGRIAGRVSDGKLRVGDREYDLLRNDGRNHLHGGRTGLDKRLWKAAAVSGPDGADSVRLTYHSPDGEEGYPGTVDISVTYTLTSGNALIIDSEALSDQVTPLCLTNHSYFNLAGESAGSIADHELQILAGAFIPTSDDMTLSGQAAPVVDGVNDFRKPRNLGAALPRLFKSHGDVYLLRTPFDVRPKEPTLAARVVDRGSGRVLEVLTDESCLQFYTALSLDGSNIGKSGRPYLPHAGLCLECQGYANGADNPVFGDILVRPGEPQRRRTIYAFSTC